MEASAYTIDTKWIAESIGLSHVTVECIFPINIADAEAFRCVAGKSRVTKRTPFRHSFIRGKIGTCLKLCLALYFYQTVLV